MKNHSKAKRISGTRCSSPLGQLLASRTVILPVTTLKTIDLGGTRIFGPLFSRFCPEQRVFLLVVRYFDSSNTGFGPSFRGPEIALSWPSPSRNFFQVALGVYDVSLP